MGIITIIFAILVFYQIGSFNAPENPYTIEGDDRDIILDFGDGAYISQLYIYTGPPERQRFSVSVYDLENEEWALVREEVEALSVFTWNCLDLGLADRYLGLVALGDRTVIMEMVAVDANGFRLLPLNAADYPGLFDEQKLFSLPGSRTYWGQMMFDEIYHGRTAYEFIHGLTTYETTHPPLGKALMAWGVRLFGMNPFGWRFMSALMGILMLPLIYAFGKALFANTLAATAATIMLAFDCMHFALSRIATIDIYAAFFILLMYYLMLRYIQIERGRLTTAPTGSGNDYVVGATVQRCAKRNAWRPLKIPLSYIPLALCGLAMGFAIATKWTGVYAGLGLGLIFLWHLVHDRPAKIGRLLAFCVAFFVAAPCLVYFASYRPFVSYAPDESYWQAFVNNNKGMFSYHSGLKAEHYYQTPFYDWPTLRMPLLYATDPVGDLMSSVSCMGNPAIWWTGIVAVLFCIYRFIVKKDMKAGFLVVAYLAQYLPWCFVERITFIYHYFPASLFMILMLAYALHLLAEKWRWGKWAAFGYLAVVVAVFAIFYPVVSGIPSDREYQFALRWLEEWILVL
jgi:dolichyl-phosphate-mannose--protein O-mannosyl transferase